MLVMLDTAALEKSGQVIFDMYDNVLVDMNRHEKDVTNPKKESNKLKAVFKSKLVIKRSRRQNTSIGSFEILPC